ncbi:hypothetical protein C9F11_21025 [Streptomyces sp. YIM 121038]|nr:hypothetical protein C9F11_21025 [Streptomyces sp. YIM 121038]
MGTPSQPRRWVSLGLVFGGHSPVFEVPPSASEPPRAPVSPVYEVDAEDAEKLMREARYNPKVPYPGARSMPWDSECIDCGARRRPSLQDIERGVRCKHIRRRSAASGV